MGRWPAFKFKQRGIEPFTLGDQTGMFGPERRQPLCHSCEFRLFGSTRALFRHIPQRAFTLDFRSALPEDLSHALAVMSGEHVLPAGEDPLTAFRFYE